MNGEKHKPSGMSSKTPYIAYKIDMGAARLPSGAGRDTLNMIPSVDMMRSGTKT